MASIHDLLLGSESEPTSRTVPQQNPSSFCQRIVLFYACGCRSPGEPVFCRQPYGGHPDPGIPAHGGPGIAPCRHERTDLIIAKLPHACGSRIGATEACSVEDPSARGFVREVDTAERLELVVLPGLAGDEISDAIPGKVDATWTVNEIVSKTRLEIGAIFSPTVTPFIPGPATRVPAVGGSFGEVGGGRVNRLYERSKTNDVTAERTAREVVVRHAEPKDDNKSSDEFFDMQSGDPILQYTARTERLGSGTMITEPAVNNKEPRPSTPAADHKGSYDDLMRFRALDVKAQAKTARARTRHWGISSLLGRISGLLFGSARR